MKTNSAGAHASEKQAVVLSASRRHALISPDRSSIFNATTSAKAIDLATGDQVLYIEKGYNLVITSILPRRNAIERSYHGELRRVVSNLDRLLIVSAVSPLFNTLFIDRVLSVATIQEIPCTLILNKIDLGLGETQALIQSYSRLGYEVLMTSAKFGDGIEQLRERLEFSSLSAVALCGVSGVGKSTILNRLIPTADRKTNEVSSRTGQGRQTTTQACGYLYERTADEALLIIDLPGIQSFGVSHLGKRQIADAFPEIVAAREGCRFSDCADIAEDRCGVKAALAEGKMERFRYDSYIHMLDEIEHAREY